jgi:luciferase family oxidoreductase group 1
MLEALHPGRVDLGIGRAPGTDQRTALALRRDEAALGADEFPAQLTDLMGYFSGVWPDNHPFRTITAVPGKGDAPDLWLLGSSGYSAQVAGVLGLPFAFAHHFMPHNTLPALQLYRDSFAPSQRLDQPYAMVCASVMAAPTDEEAITLAQPSLLGFLKLRAGRPGTTPTPEEAASYPYSAIERAHLADRQKDQILGSPETVERQLRELQQQTRADELMIVTSAFDPKDRSRSFRIVAEHADQPAFTG